MAENSPFGGPGFYQTAVVGIQGLQDDPAKENRTPIEFKTQATGNGFGRSNWTKQANSNSVISEGNLSLTELQARLRDKELQVSAMQAELVRCMKVKLEAEVKLQEHLHQCPHDQRSLQPQYVPAPSAGSKRVELLESSLAVLGEQFRQLAEKYNNATNKLEDSREEAFNLRKLLATLESAHADLTSQCARKDQEIAAKSSELAAQKEELDGWILKARRRLEAIKYLRTGEAPSSTVAAARGAENGVRGAKTGPSRGNAAGAGAGAGAVAAPDPGRVPGGKADGAVDTVPGSGTIPQGDKGANGGRERASVKERLTRPAPEPRALRSPRLGQGARLQDGRPANSEGPRNLVDRAGRVSPSDENGQRIHITDSRRGSGDRRETDHPGHVPALLPKSINVRESTLRAVKEEQERGAKRARAEDDQDAIETRKKAANQPPPGTPPGKRNDVIELEDMVIVPQGYYKTELCNKWEEQGQCPYGPKCQFAHGIDELRPVLRHPKFKTELCRLVANGYKCPYGHRCHFRHSIEGEDVPVL